MQSICQSLILLKDYLDLRKIIKCCTFTTWFLFILELFKIRSLKPMYHLQESKIILQFFRNLCDQVVLALTLSL